MSVATRYRAHMYVCASQIVLMLHVVPGYPGSTIKNKIDDRIRNGGHVECYTVPVW